MAEAYQLYQRLRSAPAHKQGAYAEVLDGGYSRGFSEEKPRFERKMAERRQQEQDRLQSHRRLTVPLLARTPYDELEEAVMDYARNKIGNQWGRDYEVVTGLPHPIQLVFAMRRMKNEIDGDGLEHLLDEEESWAYAGLALEGYRLVGSRQRAAVMARAITAMKQEKDRHPDLTEEHPALDALDRQFYALDRTEPFEPLVAQYIRQHPDQFVAD
jgi:hypothetical protein